MTYVARGRIRWDIILAILLGLGVLFTLLPVVYMITIATKAPHEVFEFPIRWIPTSIRWENVVEPLRERPFGRYFLNSTLVTMAVTLLNLTIGTMAAYSITKYRYPLRKFFYWTAIAVMVLPIEVRAVPLFLAIRSMGLIDTYWALILPDAVTGFSIFIMTQYMRTVPDELIEAARVDGAGELRTLAMIVAPVIRPGLGALSVFTIMSTWNDFFWPLIAITKDHMRTLPLGLAMFENMYVTNYPQIMSMALLVSIPVVVLFILLQRQFIESAAFSGIKG